MDQSSLNGALALLLVCGVLFFTPLFQHFVRRNGSFIAASLAAFGAANSTWFAGVRVWWTLPLLGLLLSLVWLRLRARRLPISHSLLQRLPSTARPWRQVGLLAVSGVLLNWLLLALLRDGPAAEKDFAAALRSLAALWLMCGGVCLNWSLMVEMTPPQRRRRLVDRYFLTVILILVGITAMTYDGSVVAIPTPIIAVGVAVSCMWVLGAYRGWRLPFSVLFVPALAVAIHLYGQDAYPLLAVGGAVVGLLPVVRDYRWSILLWLTCASLIWWVTPEGGHGLLVIHTYVATVVMLITLFWSVSADQAVSAPREAERAMSLYDITGVTFNWRVVVVFAVICATVAGTEQWARSGRDRAVLQQAGQVRLFQRFSQLHKTDSAFQRGTGLGLSIVKQLVDRMGGTLSYESSPGEGSCFCVELALAVAANPLAKAELGNVQVGAHDLRGLTILVVDDSELNVDVCRQFLELDGATVHAFAGGDAVLQWLAQDGHHAHAIIMDLYMPGLDGFATTEIIRQDERYSETPIIAVTAGAIASDRDRAKMAGMDEYITKPFSPTHLVTVIRTLTGRA